MTYAAITARNIGKKYRIGAQQERYQVRLRFVFFSEMPARLGARCVEIS